ncbi:hypothetical protein [Cryobacterium sp. HLT2-28]|uniref:hypothetical protein n=1 Tax=Cryobacterium sp. HLT2-28 TaxID=1259146 RepID=UPI00141B3846|nr:hypothetical protein [Cryobacterium sp. HLT2-28]
MTLSSSAFAAAIGTSVARLRRRRIVGVDCPAQSDAPVAGGNRGIVLIVGSGLGGA